MTQKKKLGSIFVLLVLLPYILLFLSDKIMNLTNIDFGIGSSQGKGLYLVFVSIIGSLTILVYNFVWKIHSIIWYFLGGLALLITTFLLILLYSSLNFSF